MKPQFITDEKGKRVSVILPIQDYNKMLEDLEELEDIKAYDEARKSNEDALVAEEAFKMIESSRDDLAD
ncbi:MAG: hypothetical protein RBS53_07335 [Bacteroidales bacterium]|jgi:hypothetical protein|nr:hypothetical protein [Bacteroidales bacterium]NLM93307.1 hypothetical protein [Bacteroidales bacterium]